MSKNELIVMDEKDNLISLIISLEGEIIIPRSGEILSLPNDTGVINQVEYRVKTVKYQHDYIKLNSSNDTLKQTGIFIYVERIR